MMEHESTGQKVLRGLRGLISNTKTMSGVAVGAGAMAAVILFGILLLFLL